MKSLAWLALVWLGTAACGRIGFDSTTTGVVDASDDARSDTGGPGLDAGVDARADANADAQLDASSDASLDAPEGDSGPSLLCPVEMLRLVDARGTAFCIDQAEVDRLSWDAAVAACAAAGKVLCSQTRWRTACRTSDPMLLDMLDEWEWTSEHGSMISVYTLGGADCETSQFINESTPTPFRCCSP